MSLIYLVIVLALMQFFFFGISVGRAREKYNVKAPATTGNEIFERYFRVQMNTLELLAMFIPAILIAAQFWSPLYIAIIGLIYFIGRIVYFNQYVTSPDKRTLGFALSMLPIVILLIASLVGIVKSLL